MEPFSKFSPVTLHFSPGTRILNENRERLMQKNSLKLEFEYVIVFVEVAYLILRYHSLREFYFKLCFMSL